MRGTDYPKNLWSTKLNETSTDQREELGAVRFVHDPSFMVGTRRVMIGFGFCAFRYIRLDPSGAALKQGALASFVAPVAVTNQTGTVTTSATTTSLTTDRFKGLVFAVTDDNGAEVAPEGEATNISSNTTTQITFDTETPLSAALASGDDGSVISWGKMVVAAASGDQAFNVAGVVATQTDRLTTSTQLAVGSYGWVGCHGLLDQVLVSADLSASGENAVIAGTGVCAPAAGTSTTQISTLIGAVPDLIGAGTALKCPVILNVLFNGAATRD